MSKPISTQPTPAPRRTARPVALITGSSRGIGAATARLLAQRGYAVAIHCVRDTQAARLLRDELLALARPVMQAGIEIESAHAYPNAIAVQGDVAQEADVLRLFAAVDTAWGRLDALVNNAGVVDVSARVDEMSFERLHRMMSIHVIGGFLCAREAVRRMSTRYGGQGGAIVNVSSAASRLGSPGHYVDYAAAKGALDVLTLGLAREVAAEGIRVNAVRPGLIATDIHASGGLPDRVRDLAHQVPMQRGGTALEVAQAIAWLLSPEASYTTMTLMDVSGGR
jgi:NAD(P)-dependent dehydrogenase (short-subunit alcohol dehydrogenase family)